MCHLQEWVKHKGLRVIVIFEGRDGAGKGGTIRAITERVSPRSLPRGGAARAVGPREVADVHAALHAAFPAAGEVVIFDRSWYNRAGVENVMGFCTKEQHDRFLENCPEIEKYIVDGGIKLIKYWLEVSDKEQKRRFEARINDPLRQWKLSPMDLPSRTRWYDYSRARDMMLEATDTKHAPWYILRSDDKKRARLNCIRHLLSLIPYKKLPREKIKLPERAKKGAYDDQATLEGRQFVPERYWPGGERRRGFEVQMIRPPAPPSAPAVSKRVARRPRGGKRIAAMRRLPTTATGEADLRVRERPTGWPGDWAASEFYVECRTCGFEPAEQLLLPRAAGAPSVTRTRGSGRSGPAGC